MDSPCISTVLDRLRSNTQLLDLSKCQTLQKQENHACSRCCTEASGACITAAVPKQIGKDATLYSHGRTRSIDAPINGLVAKVKQATCKKGVRGAEQEEPRIATGTGEN